MTDIKDLKELADDGLQQIATGGGMSMSKWSAFSNAVLELIARVEELEGSLALTRAGRDALRAQIEREKEAHATNIEGLTAVIEAGDENLRTALSQAKAREAELRSVIGHRERDIKDALKAIENDCDATAERILRNAAAMGGDDNG